MGFFEDYPQCHPKHEPLRVEHRTVSPRVRKLSTKWDGYRVIQPTNLQRDKMQITSVVEKDKALATLRENKERHSAIVAEARKGYAERALKLLSAKCDELATGKITALRFDLQVPEDHTADYELAIKMLELHSHEHIEMSAHDVRTLMMDEWDWLRQFLFTNARYTNSAAEYAKTKGVVL